MSTTADQYCCRCRRLCQGHRYQAGGVCATELQAARLALLDASNAIQVAEKIFAIAEAERMGA